MAKSEDGRADPVKSAPDAERFKKPLKAMTPAEREEALLRQRALGQQLKPLWDDIAREPLPDDFLDILNKMSPEDGDGEAGAQ